MGWKYQGFAQRLHRLRMARVSAFRNGSLPFWLCLVCLNILSDGMVPLLGSLTSGGEMSGSN